MVVEQQGQEQFARITDAMIEHARAGIGEEHVTKQSWNTVASFDSIRQWAWGIGDPNPLWIDEAYARQARWKTIIAPPTFFYSCSTGPMWRPDSRGARPAGDAGMRGIHGLFGGQIWEWFDVTRLNDRISHTGKLIEVEAKRSEYAGRTVKSTTEDTYKNQEGKVLATAKSWILAHERGTPQEHGKYQGDQLYKYTDDEIRAIAEAYDREQRRGVIPRYWEDTQVGEELPGVIKGPLTTTSMITFLMGWGSPFCMTDWIAWRYLKLHPAAGIRDPQTNIPDFPERAHWDPWFARSIGFPSGGYDIGPQRIAWYGHCLTNWMGDDGFLKKLAVELRRPNWMGDTTWIKGKVTEKYVDGNEHLVDCELWGDNQRGQRHSIGAATVRLPTKTTG